MNYINPILYAAKHRNEETRASSRSGGVFTALSDKILESGGIIYGCALADDFKAIHIRADNVEMRNIMRGSKYIQSTLGDTYKNVKHDLQTGRSVLFTGTSCQVAGLKAFLGKDFDKLYCMDIVCHGVPSPKVWYRYLRWQEQIRGGKVKYIDFRNKKDFGWREHIETLVMDNNIKINSGVFRDLFYGHSILRPACFECPYKSIIHPGDVTVADYWGIENAAPEFDDNKGVSLVLINNGKGEHFFESVKRELIYKRTKIEDSMQLPLIVPCSKPLERQQFWDDFANKSFGYVIKKYTNTGIRNKVKKKLKGIKHRLFKS